MYVFHLYYSWDSAVRGDGRGPNLCCQWLLLVGKALSITVVPEGERKWLDQQKSHGALLEIQAAATIAVPKCWGGDLRCKENMSVPETLGV